MRSSPLIRALLLFALVAITGCANHTQMSKDMLTLSPESMKMRQLQTKRFDTNDEKMVITASASVLQDLGFQVEESTPDLGILVGSKLRDATDAGQVTAAVFIALLGGGSVPIDHHQTIRVSLVTAPMAKAKDTNGANKQQSTITPAKINTACAHVFAALQKSIGEELAAVAPAEDAKAASRRLSIQMVSTFEEDMKQRMKMRDFGATRVRVTFQRIVVNTQGQVSRMEALETPELYKEFYEKLSKSVFLEANDI